MKESIIFYRYGYVNLMNFYENEKKKKKRNLIKGTEK